MDEPAHLGLPGCEGRARHAEHWQCEGGAPNTLTRNGWSKDSLKFGDQVTIDGLPGEGRLEDLQLRVVKLPDGRSVFAGSSVGNAPPPKP